MDANLTKRSAVSGIYVKQNFLMVAEFLCFYGRNR